MQLFAPKWVRFLVLLALVLVPASEAHAQRIPLVYLWCAGASLLAPFAAVPIKFGIVRLLALEVGSSRLWAISAVEWVLWFPIVVILLRFGGPFYVPLVLPVVLVLSASLHRTSVANTSWRSALLLSLSTPVLALVLPFLALGLAVLLEEYLPASVL
ncbi:MAG: hypothetical protein V3R83_00985 [Gammaproteobacteria bacterium]|jgi:hypothetical protein